jgi:membrane dipeptidase
MYTTDFIGRNADADENRAHREGSMTAAKGLEAGGGPENATARRTNKGFHPFLEAPNPYLFVDACIQAWPDADYANAHRHGAAAYAVTAWMPHAGLSQALEGLMCWHLVARKHPTLRIAETAADIRQAWQGGGAAFILATQDGSFVGRHVHRVEAFYRLGLRMMGPAYNADNLLCGGCVDRGDAGLTRLGELVVDECSRLGLLLDGSHTGRRATLEIMERSGRPFVFSHSNADALVPNPRNITDEQIRACIRTNGVVGLAPFGPLTLKPGRTEWPSLDDFFEHIDHVVQLAGDAEHVGIGSDMSLGTYPDHPHDPWGEPAYATGLAEYGRLVCSDVRSPMRALRDFNSFANVVEFADRLLRHGYADGDVHRILGGNFLRVFEQVWK